MASRTDTIRQQKRAAFLAAYARCGNIVTACEAADINRSTYYDWTEHDAAFSLAANQALQEAGDRLEEHARQWATLGIPTVKEVWERGDAIAYDVATRQPSHWAEALIRREVDRHVSPTLLIFLLNGAKPEKYKRRLEHSGAIGSAVKAIDREAWEAV